LPEFKHQEGRFHRNSHLVLIAPIDLTYLGHLEGHAVAPSASSPWEMPPEALFFVSRESSLWNVSLVLFVGVSDVNFDPKNSFGQMQW
jgi:hypothetical protein